VKAYLKAGDRETAGKFALPATEAKHLAQNQEPAQAQRGGVREQPQEIQYAEKQLAEVREKIERYNADLR